ncbi:MAG: class I adenylate-forming enzyme family protein [Rhodospirillales bacterium]
MLELDDPQVILPDLWATHARFYPKKEAVVCGPVRRTWGDFDANINRVANSLLALGLAKGDKVAVLMGNSVEMLETTFGVVRAGGCVVPLSGMLTGDQLRGLVEDCDAKILVASAEFAERLAEAQARLKKIEPEGWIAFGFAAPGWRAYETFLKGASAEQPPVRLDPSDEFNIIYSSGTTGLPKGIVQTHRARTHWAFSNAVEMGFTAESRALTTTALYSNGTWLMVLPVLFAGGTLHAMPSFDPAAFLESVERERITHSFMVPAQYLMVLAEAQLDRRDLSSLRTLLSAGSPLRSDTKREIIARLSKGLHELYGFSEGFASMLKPWQHEEKFASVGTPVLGFEVAILDDEGNELPRGEVGEIAGYGAGMMKTYHKRPEQTAELIWRDPRGRTFLRGGDIGKLDDEGFLYILDRKKDMIISGGFNVFPADVEGILGEHPAVRDVTVIGVPHARWGESCLALVVPEPGQKAAAEEIQSWANERLAKPQRLVGVEFRDDFPRNALGKVLKRQLRDPYWADEAEKG